MVEKGSLSWKGFYKKERSLRSDFISRRIDHFLEVEDKEVLDVVNRGGALSFPHTALEGSLDPVIRTSKALIDSDRDRTFAVAVLHYGNHGPSDEFSLDNFLYVLEEMKSKLGVNYPEVEAFYPPKPQAEYDDLEGRLENITRLADELAGRVDNSTSMVITGDMSHYGEFYNRKTENRKVQDQIDEWANACLDLLYRQGDLMGFMKKAREAGNDQTTPGIIAKTHLGDDLDYRIFQGKITDYSEILNEPPPIFVASYFYGVWKK